MIVVSDNSPLQYLVLIECIEALPALYKRVLTTPQVIKELQQRETPQSVAAWAKSPPAWLQIENPEALSFLGALHEGEASAISLAQECHADLVLIDERAGTDVARGIGIQTIGTLGVLIEAGLEQLIDFEDALNRLAGTTSFYASPRLFEAARQIFHQNRK